MSSFTSRLTLPAKILILRQLFWGAAFYGVYVLLTRFFLEELNYSEADTIMVLGAFGAVGPVFSAIGGFVADKFIGTFRAVYIGYSGYVVGFLLLGIGASTLSVPVSLLAIALIGYSRGMSATCPMVLIGRSFGDDQQEAFQKGLTVNYAVNNLGSFLSTYLFPFFVAYIAYAGNFYLSSGLIMVTMVMFYIYRKELIGVGNEHDKKPLPMKTWLIFTLGSVVMLGLVFWVFDNLDEGKYLLYSLGSCAILYFITQIFKASRAYQYKMCAVLIMLLIIICFYFYYGQMTTSMNMYAINVMGDRLLGFIPILPEANSAFNPMWCFVMGGPVIYAYGWMEKNDIHLSIPTKFSVAFLFTATAFGLLALSSMFVDESNKISANWVMMVHFFQSIAELIVGSLAACFILDNVPRTLSAFAVGLRAVTLSLSGILAAVISTRIALPRDLELTQEVIETVYTGYFTKLALAAVVMSVVTLLLSQVIGRLIAKGEAIEEEEQKFATAAAL